MKHLIEDAREIVCIIPKGLGKKLMDAVSQEKGIFEANFSHARGVGRSADVQDRGLGEQQEKDVFSVIVDQAQADQVFEFLYHTAELDQPHNGFIYMQKAPKSTIMAMPELASQD